ncbi:hypothetical protein GCM10009799_29340 [Nocardiopsis rhodophaea]|uniref:DUF6444 domain-containing protein n=1 Tax=Nocardiopsis rhodophaea TaxID=280238 RepID=A0ABN2T6Z3_9ACTN
MTSSSEALLKRVLARVEELETRVAELEADNTRLRAALEARDARIGELEAENAALKKENAQLKHRLGLDSTTSSQPPSSDRPWKKPAPKCLRTASGKRPRQAAGRCGHHPVPGRDPRRGPRPLPADLHRLRPAPGIAPTCLCSAAPRSSPICWGPYGILERADKCSSLRVPGPVWGRRRSSEIKANANLGCAAQA